MSWDDIRRRMLTPIEGVPPHDTSPYGATNRPPGSTNPHRGVDFNYFGGQKAKPNLSHPALRAPVDGVVENAGEGDVGRIAIRDKNGFLHELLHTHTRHVSIGDSVVAGQLIGTMGNTGVLKKGVESGDYHVHYQLKDPAGNRINPTAFWDQRGPADPNPDSPVYLDSYQQYARRLGGSAEGVVSGPDLRPLGVPSDDIAPMHAGETRSLGRRIAGQPFFKTSVAAVPVSPANPVLSRERATPFSDRYGTWTSFADAAASDGLNAADVRSDVGSAAALSPGRPAAFSDRFGNWTASPDGGVAPRNPNLLLPPSEAGRPLGIVSGQPMPQWFPAPPIFGPPDRSGPPVDEGRELLMRLVRKDGSR